MSSTRVLLLTGFGLACCAASVLAAPDGGAGPGVPQAARTLLKKRMARHGGDMNELMAATVRVDYATIAEHAGRIAAEPPLARPVTGDASEINAQIPPRFYDLQDELRRHARDLVAAAKERKAERVATTMGAMSATCVRCHALFR